MAEARITWIALAGVISFALTPPLVRNLRALRSLRRESLARERHGGQRDCPSDDGAADAAQKSPGHLASPYFGQARDPRIQQAPLGVSQFEL